MKTSVSYLPRAAQHNRGGMATIVIMALLALVLLLVTANIRALSTLGRELKFIDKKQTERWKTQKVPNASAQAAVSDSTNAPAAAPSAQRAR